MNMRPSMDVLLEKRSVLFLSNTSLGWLVDRLIDRLIDGLMDRFIDGWIGWLIDFYSLRGNCL